MKNALALIACLVSSHAFCQTFIATPHGLRDAEDTANSYITVKAPGKTAKQLYDSAISYIAYSFPDPKKIIEEDIDSTSLKFDVFVPYLLVYNNSGAKINIEAYYTTYLQFFDEKFKYEATNLVMKGQGIKYKLLFQGGFLEAYIIYNKKGKLFKEQTKIDIENYFNRDVKTIAEYLTK